MKIPRSWQRRSDPCLICEQSALPPLRCRPGGRTILAYSVGGPMAEFTPEKAQAM